MALVKLKRISPDPVLKKATYAEGAPATIAHVNDIIVQIQAIYDGVAKFGTTTALTAIAATYADLEAARTSVNTLRTDVEARLVAIEAKVDAILTGLKS